MHRPVVHRYVELRAEIGRCWFQLASQLNAKRQRRDSWQFVALCALLDQARKVDWYFQLVQISAGAVGDLYEGASRPGHFAGVLTVVNRLFEIVKPGAAVFGEKDFQQLWLIKNHFKKIEIAAVPTVREFDGLALSSRNVRLTESDRAAALIISKALKEPTRMHEILATEPAFKLDYAEIIDEKTFQIASATTQNKRAIIAGWVNGVRLLDNAVVESNS